MITLEKLAKLPRSQQLRKVAKITEDMERRCAASFSCSNTELQYLARVVQYLSNDVEFSHAARNALQGAHVILARAKIAEPSTDELRRALNTVRHIVLAETGRAQADWDFIESSGYLDPSKRFPFSGMQVYLEDIRSPFNVGSMFRAAESFGVEKVWLSPLCADPNHKRAQRTAMGCIDVLPWERLCDDPFTSTNIPFGEVPVFVLETSGIPLKEFQFPSKGILIAGSEELGVSPNALVAADHSLGRVSIPSYGAKASLNVSVAFGIVMQAWAAALHTAANDVR